MRALLTRLTSGPFTANLCLPLALLLPAVAGAQPTRVASTLDVTRDTQALASLEGEPSRRSAAGVDRAARRLWTLETQDPWRSAKRRLVLVGGLDGTEASASAVLAAVRWFKTAAPASVRAAWDLAALPCARPAVCSAEPPSQEPYPADAKGRGTAGEAPAAEAPFVFPPDKGYYDDASRPESRYLWRWIGFQAPDLVVELRHASPAGFADAFLTGALPSHASEPLSLAAAVAGAGFSELGAAYAATLRTDPAHVPDMMAQLFARAADTPRSPLRDRLDRRVSRSAEQIARLMAARYPGQPAVSYIPSLAWASALRLSTLTGDTAFRDRVRMQMAPFVSGVTPTIAEPYLLTSLAGHLAFVELERQDGQQAAGALARKAADFILPSTAGDLVRFRRAWTDDMFMATAVLARVGAMSGDTRYLDAAARLVRSYIADLQRPDGVFIHAKEGPHAWGRGNGFAMFGLVETLTVLPETHADRPVILDSYRRLVAALARQQSPDGMWRQVLDEEGSYREFTVTAMMTVALARGLRLGWIPRTNHAMLQRAWSALAAHIADDGTMVDICTGTGSGATRRYYLDRPAIVGADDRGGGMALYAAVEMMEK